MTDEYIILTKKEAVERYGSDNCKNHFSKYGKFKNKKIEEALLKTIRQHYECVEIIKQGRSNVYKLSNKRFIMAERERNLGDNISNGNWKYYTKNLDIMIVSTLELELNKDISQTLGRWAVDFGIISDSQYDLLTARYNKDLRSEYIENSLDVGVIKKGEEYTIDDYTRLVSDLIKHLSGTLDRMSKLGIIEMNKVYKAYVESEDKHIEIHYSTYKKYLDIRRELMDKYGLNNWYISRYYKSHKVMSYRKELKDRLLELKDEDGNALNISNCYSTFFIAIKAEKNKVIKYLEKYNKEAIEKYVENSERFLLDNENEYYENRIEYIKDKTDNKVKKFKEENGIGDLSNVLGGKKKRHFINMDEIDEYHKLYLNNLLTERMLGLERLYGYSFKNK